MKGKERVPVPVAGPAFRCGVKFVIFYVFGSFLQPAAKIDPIQSALPPVSNPSLGVKKREREKSEIKPQKAEAKTDNKDKGATRQIRTMEE